MNSLLDKHWHHLPTEEVIDLLDSDRESGLDTFEVKRRQERFGWNLLTAKKKKSAFISFLQQFNNPLIIILILASVLTAVLKDPVDAGVIFGVVLINAIIGYIQESKAEQAISALAKTMTTEASVIRSGKVIRIPAIELVPGDIVQLQAGMRIPADLRLISSRDLQVVEAALTGESLPVQKSADGIMDHDVILAERKNMAYTSTLVTYGTATGIVTATGDNTEIGRISKLISSAADLETPLTRNIARFSKMLLVAILILAALTFGIGILRGEDLIETLSAAIALAVGAIPEGLPAAVTVTLAIGVSRMAKRQAVIRRLPAVETLGSTTVICSDKTGTLTQNQMTVKEIHLMNGKFTVSGVGYQPEGSIEPVGGSVKFQDKNQALMETLKAGLLCNDSQLVEKDGAWSIQGDPTEGALIVAARKASLSDDMAEYPERLDSIPFDSQHQFMATLHADGTIYVKGAAEVLMDKCKYTMDDQGQLSPCNKEIFKKSIEEMAGKGLRVLAFASRKVNDAHKKLDFNDIHELTILGLQGLIDPPRPEAIAAINACHQAGINVKMITGDHGLTAAAIGQQIGLCGGKCDEVLIGSELSKLTDAELIEKVKKVNIFARVSPEQKLRLVEALQSLGHVAAMTGDGVNDAPALKQANIGIAMGITGTEVSKEAADMVLTDDNFATIEAAVEEGRGVFDNLTKYIAWTLPTNLGEGMLLLVAILIGEILPILPLQVLWINMVTSAVLGMALSLEPKEPGLMKRKPRDPKAPILNGILIWRIILVSLIILIGSFTLFELELANGAPLSQARTVAVNVVIFVELFYLFNSRSSTLSPFQLGFLSNPWAIGGAILMFLIQLAFTYTPFMNQIFKSAPISLLQWAKVFGVSLAGYFLIELEKFIRRKRASTD